MSTHDDLETRLERWLKDDAPALPDRVSAAVRAEVMGTRQQRPRWWSPIGVRPEHWSVASGLAAIMLVVVVVGGGILIRQQGVGGTASALPSTPPVGASPSGSLAGDPFVGRWSTTDGDGSPMTLDIEGSGSTREVSWTDHRSTHCMGEGETVTGTGTIEGVVIRVVGLGGCVGGPMDTPAELQFTYDPRTGSLASALDFQGIDHLTWTRGPTPPDVFSGGWLATDVDGSVVTLTFSGSGSLSRQVTYHDSRVESCAVVGGGYDAEGLGTIGSVAGDGRFVRVALGGACADGSSPHEAVEKYEFDLLTGTLIGPQEPLEVGGVRGATTVVWRRP